MEIVQAWVEAFNAGDADRLAGFYAENAENHQVANKPVEGREAIKAMFRREFATTEMFRHVKNLFEHGNWAILEWRDPLGPRGCGFFRIEDGKIAFQPSYWDQRSFRKFHGLPEE
jgi:nuclear transport factor 2 (NTF2) superfamily protein